MPPRAHPWPEDHEPTEFQAAVVAVVAGLGPGELATYGEVAEEVGRPGAGQAVSNVLRSAPDLPWWRVVNAAGRLVPGHEAEQAARLAEEGVAVDVERGRVRSRHQADS